MKNDLVMPIKVQAQKWYLAYFGPSVGYFGKHLPEMDLKCGQNSQLKAQNRPYTTFEPEH